MESRKNDMASLINRRRGYKAIAIYFGRASSILRAISGRNRPAKLRYQCLTTVIVRMLTV